MWLLLMMLNEFLLHNVQQCIAWYCHSNPVCLFVCYVRDPWLNRLMISTAWLISPGTWITALHCSSILLCGNISKFWVKDEGVCTEVAFAIQNQRCLWSKVVYSQTYHRVSIETRVWPIDWWQIWWPMVNFDLLFQRAKFFHKYISHTFCWSATKFCLIRGLANPRI